MISFKCIYCGQGIAVQEGTYGKQIKCPKCSHKITVPGTAREKTNNDQSQAQTIQDNPFTKKLNSDPLSTGHPGSLNNPLETCPLEGFLNIYSDKIKKYIPHYERLSLFFTAFSLVLIFIFNNQFRQDLSRILVFTRIFTLRNIFFLLISLFVFGFLLSLYHFFSNRKISRLEKYTMLFFAAFTNAAAGIGTGVYIIMHSFDWRIIFALWNIANSILMIIMLKAGLINISCINDRKMTLDRAVIGLIMMFIVFAICNFVFDFYWLITFSICTIYTTNFERSIQSIFFGRTKTLST